MLVSGARLDAAIARGARGFMRNLSAFGSVPPSVPYYAAFRGKEPRGPCAARALRDAGLQPEQIGYINAHGTGTNANDSSEAAAIRAVFRYSCGSIGREFPPSRCTVTRWARRRPSNAWRQRSRSADGVLPPTANFNERDPECDLDVIPNQAGRLRWNGRYRIRSPSEA